MISFDNFYTSLQSISQGQVFVNVIEVLITISPIVLAFIFFIIFWHLWVDYVQSDFISTMKYTLFEIKLPKEMMKSPLAMEVFLAAIHNTSDGGNYARYWKGEKRPTYSLEIISVEGVVKFLIRTEDRRKAGVLSALYSQFPGIEVNEVEDYTKGIHYDPKESKLWGTEFKFSKPDPYPIKTYVDYGLDKDPKEEFKVDPLVPMLEYLGSVGMNQQVWIQYIVRAHVDEQKKPGHLFAKTDAWKDQAKKLVDDLMLRDAKTKVAGMKDEATGFTKLPSISKGEQDVIEAIERSMTKLPFDVGIRALYIAKREVFDTPFGIGGIIGSFKHFNTEHLNGINPSKKWVAKLNNVPWEDYKNLRRTRLSKLILEAYKRRSFFYAPFKGSPIVMNTEELATIFHFPGAVAGTPTLTRIPSRKSEAPSNLPI